MPTTQRPVLLSGGDVFTGDPQRLWSEAVVLREGVIAATGSRADLTARFPDAVEFDVTGGTVVPGFIDAHNHFLATGEALAAINARFPACASIDQLVAELTAAAASTPPGQWISAFGFDDPKYPRPLTRWDLDAASVEHPIRVYHVSGHHVVVNSTALAMRGVDDRTPDPQGGRFVRDAGGRLTGFCLDAAMNLILPVAVDIASHGPNFHTATTVEESVAAVDRASRAFLEAGLTTVCDAQVTSRELVAYQEARTRGVLGVRTVCMPLSHQLDALLGLGLSTGFGDDRLRLGAMKFYADGSLIGGTACFHDAYGENGDLEGSMYWEPGQLAEAIGRAHTAGWQVGVHVQGDKAMAIVLDAIEAAVDFAPRDHRHRLEHAGYPTPELIARIARLGVITVNQPSYLHDSGDDFLARLGERAHRLQPLSCR
jgi:predicted amidohydrolase YtcJ